MSNLNVGGNKPLLPPSQLWSQRQAAPVKPAATQPAPAVSGQTQQPAQPLLPHLPPLGKSMPLISFSGAPPQTGAPKPAPTGLSGQLTQLRGLIKSADDRLMNYYNVKLVKDDKGQITGYQLNGQNVSQQALQQHLLPQAGILHQQITDLRQEIAQTFQNFQTQVQQQMPALAPAEQTAVKIQLQAVQVVYQGFVNRLGQVDALIK